MLSYEKKNGSTHFDGSIFVSKIDLTGLLWLKEFNILKKGFGGPGFKL